MQAPPSSCISSRNGRALGDQAQKAPAHLFVPWLGRDLLLCTAARGDRKEKGKLTDGREKLMPTAVRVGQTPQGWPQASPSNLPRPSCAELAAKAAS
uniref:Uncharacterized protein n=1 Tax=Mus musculus TaxID=10090 RepID=Q3UP29_MOUSE|nr:unnamed protein product [Mus musculus]